MAKYGKLNAQMERFCQEYIKNPDNQTAAAAVAGYKKCGRVRLEAHGQPKDSGPNRGTDEAPQ
ncbi:hypothetical protein CR62_16645 [Serratia grimesii]|uniref:Terminase small subunit n=1 Tax=Serratia grimesii TaxID=82995 RepID=A0ABR4UD54_9GAMM|nr:hypothetical protein CR62_16645 [Serratia grimesii]